MQNNEQSVDTNLARRLALASEHRNMGEDMTRQDYTLLLIVTVLVPVAMMLVGWYL